MAFSAFLLILASGAGRDSGFTGSTGTGRAAVTSAGGLIVAVVDVDVIGVNAAADVVVTVAGCVPEPAVVTTEAANEAKLGASVVPNSLVVVLDAVVVGRNAD